MLWHVKRTPLVASTTCMAHFCNYCILKYLFILQGGLVWSPYTTEYAMEDFYRNVSIFLVMDNDTLGNLWHERHNLKSPVYPLLETLL